MKTWLDKPTDRQTHIYADPQPTLRYYAYPVVQIPGRRSLGRGKRSEIVIFG
ncbi:hypothetical protein [Scytonema millei]|uniref:Uncharacterized protein n=1 Tax=Scytonema millei VB511283 TaxID=1245923 RepID=A0A9X5I6I4_9CYAN|nr:hypothetical protein [Scytonema millei]NHC37141.1 hypothetical protein [Scytonema millei VB511283]